MKKLKGYRILDGSTGKWHDVDATGRFAALEAVNKILGYGKPTYVINTIKYGCLELSEGVIHGTDQSLEGIRRTSQILISDSQ